MAKASSAAPSSASEKEPGRFKQIWQVLKMTAKYDKTAVWLLVGAVVVPIVIAVVVAILFFSTNVLMLIMVIVLGLMAGLLLFMFTLNWRAEKVAFSQIDGRAGATGQVLQSSLRGQWQTSEMPVAFNAKTQDAVYRAIGKPGVVLITEGSATGVKRIFDEERRRTQRLLTNVPVHHLHVGNGEGQVPLLKLRRTLNKLPGKLTKAEIVAVANRLKSLSNNQLPIPKGIAPNKIRPSRSQQR